MDCFDKTGTAGYADSSDRLHGLDENELVEAAKAGQDAAFNELLRPHSKRILRVIYRITKNREDAEDALQDAFLKAFVHIKNFDNRSKFSTWLTRIAINSALMVIRKKRPEARLFLDAGEDGGRFDLAAIPDHALTPEASYAKRERRAMIRGAIRALPPTIRQAIELQRLEELSVTETAERLGLSLAAARSRLFRARDTLRKTLAGMRIPRRNYAPNF
jgi:RNA polymerase sigma-70 factor (ECF subfamily)